MTVVHGLGYQVIPAVLQRFTEGADLLTEDRVKELTVEQLGRASGTARLIPAVTGIADEGSIAGGQIGQLLNDAIVLFKSAWNTPLGIADMKVVADTVSSQVDSVNIIQVHSHHVTVVAVPQVVGQVDSL